MKARLRLLLVVLGLAGVAAPNALIGDVGNPIGYHDGDRAPIVGEEALVDEL